MKKLLLACCTSLLFLSPVFADPQPSLTNPKEQAAKISSNILDLSQLIDGHLFFVLKNPQTGAVSYTRDPIFLKREGYFYQQNDRLQGYTLSNTLTAEACTLSDIKVPLEVRPAVATSLVVAQGINLDSSSAIPDRSFNEQDPGSFNFTVYSSSVMDSKGIPHLLSLYFIKKSANAWDVRVFIDQTFIKHGRQTFNTAGSPLTTVGLDEITFTPYSTSEPQTFAIKFSGLTQFATPMQFQNMVDNGDATSYAMEEWVDKAGYIYENYSNYKTINFGKIAVSSYYNK